MLLNLLSILDCLSFSVEGGGTPCVLVYFDDPESLQQIASSDEYHNLILENNEQVFQEQIELFSFFFGTDGMDDVKIIIGGAPVSEEAMKITGADEWAHSPQKTVQVCKDWAEAI